MLRTPERILVADLFHLIGYSRNEYLLPVNLDQYKITSSSPAHKGRFKFAVDIWVPLSDLGKKVVYAPASGVVEHSVVTNTMWGTTSDYAKYTNYMNVLVKGDEFYEIAHIAPFEGRILKAGDFVKTGEPVGVVALNGWITTTGELPDLHVHMMVGKWLSRKTDFRSLRIRWKK